MWKCKAQGWDVRVSIDGGTPIAGWFIMEKMNDLGVTPGNLHVSKCIWWVVSDHVFLPKLELLVVGLVGHVFLATKRHRCGWLCHFMVSHMYGFAKIFSKMYVFKFLHFVAVWTQTVSPNLPYIASFRSAPIIFFWEESSEINLWIPNLFWSLHMWRSFSFQAGDESAALNIPRQSKAGDVAIPWFQRGWNMI